jgi:hypothetical protein
MPLESFGTNERNDVGPTLFFERGDGRSHDLGCVQES